MSDNLSLIPNSILFNKRSNKKGSCPLSGPNAPAEINYKDVELLSKYISDGGRILPSRVTGVCAKKQRQLKKAIKRARAIALLPFSSR